MILIVTALMVEASPIINHFKLKKDMKSHAYAIYRNSDMALVVSGVGKLKSAAATTYLCASYGTTEADIIINLGFCGTGSRKYIPGTLLLINKITDMDTEIDYYPDILFGKNLPKESLLCNSKLVRKEHIRKEDVKIDIFCDMESSGFFEAAAKFAYSHNIVVLKIISDYLEPDNISKKLLRDFIQGNIPKIEYIIDELKKINSNISKFSFTKAENEVFSSIFCNLYFSEAMKQRFLKDMKAAKLKGIEPLDILEPFINQKVDSKAQGKLILEQIKERSSRKYV